MAKFKVILVFQYDSEENIKDWNTDSNIEHVTNADEAIETAIAELDANGASGFSFDVFDENGEFIKSN